MNDLVSAPKAADWYKLTALVLDSVSSPITRRVYNMALDEFMVWSRLEPAAGIQQGNGQRLARVTRGPQARFVVEHYPHVGHPQAGGGGGR